MELLTFGSNPDFRAESEIFDIFCYFLIYLAASAAKYCKKKAAAAKKEAANFVNAGFWRPRRQKPAFGRLKAPLAPKEPKPTFFLIFFTFSCQFGGSCG